MQSTAAPEADGDRRSWRAIGGVLVLALLWAACGSDDPDPIAAEPEDTTSTSVATEPTEPTDELIDVGGRSLHLVCQGEGSPTVMIDLGAGDRAVSWNNVQPELSLTNRTCVYERAGIGGSEPAPEPRDADAVTTDLVALLDAAEIDGPIVLVAHSIAGVYAEHFARAYPADLAGVVFVDPRAAEFQLGYRDVLTAEQLEEDDAFLEGPIATAPEGPEIAALDDAARQAVDAGPFPDVPVVVLTAGVREFEASLAEDALWVDTHEALAALSDHGTQRVVDGADHFIWRTDPDAVIDAVREVLTG